MSKYDSPIFAGYRLYFLSGIYLGWFIFNLQILCENESTVLVTLNEGKLFGEVSECHKARVLRLLRKTFARL